MSLTPKYTIKVKEPSIPKGGKAFNLPNRQNTNLCKGGMVFEDKR